MSRSSRPDTAVRSPAQRLNKALEELASRVAHEAPTAVKLCELAGVSRNALYRYHGDILRKLRMLQRQRLSNPSKAVQTVQRLREENKTLRDQVASLAAMVDHYFAAWQESSMLLKRCERELADVRHGGRPRFVAIPK